MILYLIGYRPQAYSRNVLNRIYYFFWSNNSLKIVFAVKTAIDKFRFDVYYRKQMNSHLSHVNSNDNLNEICKYLLIWKLLKSISIEWLLETYLIWILFSIM